MITSLPRPVRVGVVESVKFNSRYVAFTKNVVITKTLRLVTRTWFVKVTIVDESTKA